jgi:hypothetical protein
VHDGAGACDRQCAESHLLRQRHRERPTPQALPEHGRGIGDHLHNVVWITIVLHPTLVDLVDESPATTVYALQDELDILETVR